MAKPWNELREEFRVVFSRWKVKDIAKEIPVSRQTLYYLMSGKSRNPSKAVHAGIERIVTEEKKRADQ